MSNIVAQRIPLGPGRVAPPLANNINARVPPVRAQRQQIPIAINARRASRIVAQPTIVPTPEEEEDDDECRMDVEEVVIVPVEPETEAGLHAAEQEVEQMIGVEESDEEVIEPTATMQAVPKPTRVWPEVSTEQASRYRKEIGAIVEVFDDQMDMYDTTMVSEYAEEIFTYMNEIQASPALFPPSSLLTVILGGCDAQGRLYLGPKRDHLANAANSS